MMSSSLTNTAERMRLIKHIERFQKRLLISFLRKILHTRRLENQKWDLAPKAVILVVRCEKKMGNSILTLPFLHGLRRLVPEGRIILLIDASQRELFEINKDISALLVFPKNFLVPWVGYRFIRQLRQLRAAAAFDVSNPGSFSFSNGFVTWLSGAALRIGFDRGDSDLFLNVNIPANEEIHYSTMLLDLLHPIGRGKFDSMPKIDFKPDERLIRQYQALGRSASGSIGIWVGAEGQKQWPVENFIKTGRILADRYSVYYLFGTGENSLYKTFPDDLKLFSLQYSSMRELAHCLKQFSLVVACDTGPMHLAAALNVPTLGLFLWPREYQYGYNDPPHQTMRVTSGPESVDLVIKKCRELVIQGVQYAT